MLGPGALAEARSDDGARLLLLSGQPIGEPVARSGPFVMSTDAELTQAWEDYRTGRLVSPSLGLRQSAFAHRVHARVASEGASPTTLRKAFSPVASSRNPSRHAR